MKKFNFKKIVTMGLAAIMAVSAMSMSAFAAESSDVYNVDNAVPTSELITFDENGNPILPEGWLTEDEMKEIYDFDITVYTGEDAAKAKSDLESRPALSKTRAILTDDYTTSTTEMFNNKDQNLLNYTNITLNFKSTGGTPLYSKYYMSGTGASTLGYFVESTDSSTKKATMYLVGEVTKNGTTNTGIIATLSVPTGGNSTAMTMDISNMSVRAYSSIVNSNASSVVKTGSSVFYAR